MKTSYVENSINELKGIIEKAKNAEKFKDKDITFNEYFESFKKLDNESTVVQLSASSTVDSIKEIIKNLKDGLEVK